MNNGNRFIPRKFFHAWTEEDKNEWGVYDLNECEMLRVKQATGGKGFGLWRATEQEAIELAELLSKTKRYSRGMTGADEFKPRRNTANARSNKTMARPNAQFVWCNACNRLFRGNCPCGNVRSQK